MTHLQIMLSEDKSLFDRVVFFFCISFIILNSSARVGVLFFSGSLLTQLLGVGGGVCCWLILYRPDWIRTILFCFALTFPLYGSLSYSTHSVLFDLYVTFFALILCINCYRQKSYPRRKNLLLLVLFLYAFFSVLSIFLLPVQNIGWQLLLWQWDSYWNAILFATPESPLYPLAALNRFLLYITFLVFMVCHPKARELFVAIFIGLIVAAVWSSVVGILNYYNMLELSFFRDEFSSSRLQSVFANPGWFAEFLSISIPFVLLGFLRSDLNKLKKIALFGVLIICEVAIILTYSRTGWLIYPFVLIVCWFFFYLVTNTASGRFTWKRIGKVVLQVVISVPLTLIVSYYLIFHLFNISEKSSVNESRLEQRVSKLTNPAARMVIWQESFDLIKEKPVFGLGYESFKYHNKLLHKVKKDFDTPHNLFLQMMVSGGVVGLLLWGMIIFSALFLLIADLVRNKNYTNIAVMLSIVAFHQYGLAQSMQYIPMIWFLVFLNIGYAMTIDEAVLQDWARNGGDLLVKLLVGVVVLAGIAYAGDFESRSLARKYNMDVYSLDQEQDSYLGFYPVEDWKKEGAFRWTADGAIIRLPQGEIFELTYVCSAPDSERKPVVVTVYSGHTEIDTVSFYRSESITRQYHIPQAMQENVTLYFHVSRTWNLKKMGVADDTRNLGVAISDVRVVDAMPEDGVGFYHWESWQGSALPGESAKQFDYRWTGPKAMVPGKQVNGDNVLFVRAGQPGLPGKPLVVEMWQQEKLIGSIALTDTDWHRVKLSGNVQNNGLLSIKSSRTWNAKSIAVGEDSRNLGVAVAGLKKTM